MEVARKAIDMKITAIDGDSIAWIKIIPLKVSGFMWRERIGHNLVVVTLEKRGLQLSSTSC